MDSFVLICVSEADISGDRKLFVKMSDGNRVLILLLTLVFEIEKALMKPDSVMRNLNGGVCFSIYVCYTCFVFDCGKRSDGPILMDEREFCL